MQLYQLYNTVFHRIDYPSSQGHPESVPKQFAQCDHQVTSLKVLPIEENSKQALGLIYLSLTNNIVFRYKKSTLIYTQSNKDQAGCMHSNFPSSAYYKDNLVNCLDPRTSYKKYLEWFKLPYLAFYKQQYLLKSIIFSKYMNTNQKHQARLT